MFGSYSRQYAGLRQFLYPEEFRIPLIGQTEDLEVILKKIIEILSGTEGSQEQVKFLAEVGTGLWRLRQKMIKPGTDQPVDEMRRAYRHLESTWDVLSQFGVFIQDHTDALYDSGMALKVVAFQPDPATIRERVSETIKPSIYFKEENIQMGEVIVVTPEKQAGRQS